MQVQAIDTRRCILGLLMGATLAVHGLPASGQTVPPRRVQAPHTVVELIADRVPEPTTRELWMGLRFELEQGWHIYWQNPGDSGGPPTVLWQPTPGLTAAEFEWPLPERIPLGPLVNYGYTNEVVLPFRVTLAKPLAAGGNLAVEGQFKWLICLDICIPGQARLSLGLPLRAADRSLVTQWHGQIEQARQQVPRQAPAAWRAHATSANDSFVLTVRMDQPAGPATFFPLDVSLIDDAAEQGVKASGRELTLRLRKSDQWVADPKLLRGVLALRQGGAFVIEAPIGPSPGAAAPHRPPR